MAGWKDNLKPFKKGEGGRPKGSKNKLTDAFWNDFAGAWKKHGAAALETVATTQPDVFLKVAASVMPKEVTIEKMDGLSNEQLERRIEQLASALGFALGIGEASGGEEAPARPH